MTEAGPSKSPVLSTPKSHFDSISSNSSKHVQLGLGHGPPPTPSRRWTQDSENVFSTRNNRRRIHSDSFGKGRSEEGSPVMPKTRLPTKHDTYPLHLVEADANITAFSDEYDLGECTTFLMRSILLTLLPAHEGNGMICTFFGSSVSYRYIRSCNSCRCSICSQSEGTERSSIAGNRSNTHRCLASVLLLKLALSE